jgi:hypothetical protein
MLHPRRRGIKVGRPNLPKRAPILLHRLLFFLWQLDLLAADRRVVLSEASGDTIYKHGKSHHSQHRSIHCSHFVLYAGLGFFILPIF